MLTHELKDYVVFRHNRTGNVYQCHKGLWKDWMQYDNARGKTKLVENVTTNEARRFCQLTKDHPSSESCGEE